MYTYNNNERKEMPKYEIRAMYEYWAEDIEAEDAAVMLQQQLEITV